MAASEAHMKATRKWEAKAYDRVALNVPKGQRQIIKDFAETHGYSTNAFILEAVREKMERMEQIDDTRQRDGLEYTEAAEHGKPAEKLTDLR